MLHYSYVAPDYITAVLEFAARQRFIVNSPIPSKFPPHLFTAV